MFWIFGLGNSRGDVEQFISSWGQNVNLIKDYIGASLAFECIFVLSLLLSSRVIVTINFPFKEHQQRWYILVTFIVSLYIWAYGLRGGVISFLVILIGLYRSFSISYGREKYSYERIAKENGRKIEIIKVPVYDGAGNSSKDSNIIKENVENIKKNLKYIFEL